MNLFGLAPEHIASDSSGAIKTPSLNQSLLIGGIGFCAASLLVFATVAFAERWMYQHMGLSGAYATWTMLFIFLGGAVFIPLLVIRAHWWRFYILFSVAFLFYAVGWIGAYFTLRGKVGEWLGSLAGSVLMGLILAIGFNALRTSAKLIAILFVSNSIGYFLGDALNNAIGGKLGMLLWGVAFGLFLGAGLGTALYFAQASLREQLQSAVVTERP
jgi:hypothetical protein